ncbi:LuxR C-terminal-related transcriptional regulator [Dictyobacter arantiisoli]|uniref:DNA-binding response regulator n=1 Tax=Dictyobacter arantiisoli TaxID=2014874 RepID=A0A5A5TIF1_9CHLR|nr:response regulator transcription factor [Dictyobacter arantiisoli]GCF11380.1 DNA-binding response regulator [Dictyobacter arantiisoli]
MGNKERKKISLLIANDHQVVQDGLRCMLAGSPEIELVGCASSIPETIRLVGECEPDVLLIDPHMPEQDGWQAIQLIRGEWPQVAILIYTGQQHDDHLLRALRAGVSAYLPLRSERAALLYAIHAVGHGHTLLAPEAVARLLACINTNSLHLSAPGPQKSTDSELTEREREVLQRVVYGERNKEIAVCLSISEPTVKSHLASIYFKLGVDSRASAVAVALERGILTLQKR